MQLQCLGNRKPKQSSVSVDSGRGSGLRPTVDDIAVKEKPVVVIPMKPLKRDSILASPVINEMDTSEVIYLITILKAAMAKIIRRC